MPNSSSVQINIEGRCCCLGVPKGHHEVSGRKKKKNFNSFKYFIIQMVGTSQSNNSIRSTTSTLRGTLKALHPTWKENLPLQFTLNSPSCITWPLFKSPITPQYYTLPWCYTGKKKPTKNQKNTLPQPTPFLPWYHISTAPSTCSLWHILSVLKSRHLRCLNSHFFSLICIRRALIWREGRQHHHLPGPSNYTLSCLSLNF